MIIDIPFDFVDIGFNTQVRKWMLEFYDNSGMQTGVQMVRGVEIYNGCGSQFAFKNPMMGGPRPIWHVRERYYKTEINQIEIVQDTAMIKSISSFKPYVIPENYVYLRYNYSINNNICKLFFLDSNHVQIGEPCIRRYVLVDGLDHKTHGDYPNIYLECKRDDVREVILTDSYAIITGHVKREMPKAAGEEKHVINPGSKSFHIDTTKKK